MNPNRLALIRLAAEKVQPKRERPLRRKARRRKLRRIRRDLFGVVGLLAIREGETMAVQTTSGSNVAARVKKISEAEALPDMRAAGWSIKVHGWRKAANGRWQVREVDVS